MAETITNDSATIQVTKEWRAMANVQIFIRQGEDFLKAYQTLRQHNRNHQPPQSIQVADAVNLAFALELLLKGVHAVNFNLKRGHDLKKLFDELPAELRQSIRKNIATYVPYSDEQFEQFLKDHARSFEEWRYSHERGYNGFNFQFCEAFSACLIDTLRSELDKLRDIVRQQHADGLLPFPKEDKI